MRPHRRLLRLVASGVTLVVAIVVASAAAEVGVVAAPSDTSVPAEPLYTTVDYPGPRQVALTFDDGPYFKTTSAVLDILRRQKVGATFFVVGYMANRSDNSRAVLRRAHDEGHSIQNHSWTHPHLAGLGAESVERELARTSRLIEQLTGVAPTIFRPPFGSTSDRVRATATSIGLRQMLWGASPRNMNDPADRMVSSVLGQAKRYRKAGRGLVVLLHDGSGNRAATVKALPEIIKGLKKAGWEFVVVR